MPHSVRRQIYDCSANGHVGIGVFQDYYQSTFLKSYTASDISWIGSLELFIMLAGVSSYNLFLVVLYEVTVPGAHRRSSIRYIRTTTFDSRRNLLPRLRLDDGVLVDNLLPAHSFPRNLQSHRYLFAIQSSHKLRHLMVLEEVRVCCRHRRSRIRSRRNHFANHGEQTHPPSRLWLDNAHCRIPATRPPHLRHSHHSVAHPTQTTTAKRQEILQPLD